MLRAWAIIRRVLLIAAIAAVCTVVASAQGVKRLVIVKVDGLPNYYVDRLVRERDPATGRSRLPWIDEVFYKNGTRLVNFYTRGMSLSAPSWGQLDTGQHLQIKGNVEFDRFTLHAYDYLNFIPFYLNYSRNKTTDMPAVEVLDQLGVPLLSDAFPFDKKYMGPQLYQRGNDWALIAGGFMNMLPRNKDDAIDEWTLGFDVRNLIKDQNVRDITGKLVKRPEIDYFDLYSVDFDHTSHHFNDDAARLNALKEVDRLIGSIWNAIQQSSRADETALVMVSDHGFNSEEGTYSQGFNLVKLLGSSAGGGHHVITKRRLMMDYAIKGLYPFVPLITTTSDDSFYLKGQSTKYPTALVDFDGNERSSIHFRENDLNILHILFQQLKGEKLTPEIRSAAAEEFFRIVDRHRPAWQQTVAEMDEELDALHRWIEAKQKLLPGLMMKVPKGEGVPGLRRKTEENRRFAAQVAIAVQQEDSYRKYLKSLSNLLALKRDAFDARRLDIDDYIAPGSMGEPNTIGDLQNYVVGLSAKGLSVDGANGIDFEKSFTRVNYFELLHDQAVRSNVQQKVGSRPIDFIATRIPLDKFPERLLNGSDRPNQDAIWLYGSEEKQALLLTRTERDGSQSYQYCPIARLHQGAEGIIRFETRQWIPGFPLKLYEDPALAVPADGRSAWLSDWHSESEWLNATHKTIYSNAIIGLNEQIVRHAIPADESTSDDDQLIYRFRQRQRHLTEPDILIVANDHWDFDVRGFNPGGNHGSFFRVSTNSTFMIAGGPDTGVPRGLAVETPYDGMSFVPTLLRLMGKIDSENRPVPELYERGYRRFPGRVVREVITK